MSDQQVLERITINSKVMGGKPVIKGTRLIVWERPTQGGHRVKRLAPSQRGACPSGN